MFGAFESTSSVQQHIARRPQFGEVALVLRHPLGWEQIVEHYGHSRQCARVNVVGLCAPSFVAHLVCPLRERVTAAIGHGPAPGYLSEQDIASCFEAKMLRWVNKGYRSKPYAHLFSAGGLGMTELRWRPGRTLYDGIRASYPSFRRADYAPDPRRETGKIVDRRR